MSRGKVYKAKDVEVRIDGIQVDNFMLDEVVVNEEPARWTEELHVDVSQAPFKGVKPMKPEDLPAEWLKLAEAWVYQADMSSLDVLADALIEAQHIPNVTEEGSDLTPRVHAANFIAHTWGMWRFKNGETIAVDRVKPWTTNVDEVSAPSPWSLRKEQVAKAIGLGGIDYVKEVAHVLNKPARPARAKAKPRRHHRPQQR